MSTLLILGRTEDVCCQLVAEQARAGGSDVLLLPEDQLLPGLLFTWAVGEPAASSRLRYNDCDLPLSDISGVLFRCYGVPISAEQFQTRDGQYVSAEWHALCMAWLDQLACPVVNRLHSELWYKSYLNVPDLRARVPDLPFTTARVGIVTRASDARAFCESAGGTVMYSPLGQPASYPIRDAQHLERLMTLSRTLPLYLIERGAGERHQAFVIGDEVVLVDRDGTRAAQMPPELAERCVTLGAQLGLSFFRLDLVRNPQGDWICHSLDRMPQLYGSQPDVQRSIAAAIVRLVR